MAGAVNATFTPGSWTYTDPADAAPEETEALTPSGHPYIDVTLIPSSGSTLATNLTIPGSDLTVSENGNAIAVNAQNARWLGGNTYRFFLDGSFVAGVVTVTFQSASLTDSNATLHTNWPFAASSSTFTVLGPTATVVAPGAGSTASGASRAIALRR